MPLVVYSLLRLALFGAVLLGLWRVGMGGWLAVVVAAFAAWALSYVLLARPRDDAALWLAERSAQRAASGRRFSRAAEEDAAAEDAEVDSRTEPDEVDRLTEPDEVASLTRPDEVASLSEPDEAGPELGRPGQTARPRPSSTP